MDVARKKGKKNRKHGRGNRKVERSRWRSFENLIKAQLKRRAEKLARRFCLACDTQFHSLGALKRHGC